MHNRVCIIKWHFTLVSNIIVLTAIFTLFIKNNNSNSNFKALKLKCFLCMYVQYFKFHVLLAQL